MVDRWQMTTEFMLQRVESHTLKRMIDDIKDGMNYKLSENGDLIEESLSPIDRNKSDLNDRLVEKVESETGAREAVEDKLSELKNRTDVPGMKQQSGERQAKVEVLEEVIDEVEKDGEQY